jgi:hypothetical protein
MLYVCTVAAGLRHTGRIYPHSSQKNGGGGIKVEEGSILAVLSSLVLCPPPPPNETILLYSTFAAWFVQCTLYMQYE